MTKQEIFDKVKAHLLAQGKRAVNGDGNCMYRGMDGTKCAVGCLIPDELYTPLLENHSAYGICSPSNPDSEQPEYLQAAARVRDLLGLNHDELED